MSPVRSRRVALAAACALAASALAVVLLPAPRAAAEGDGAEPPAVVRELEERRTQYATTYELSDGSLRTVLSQTPVHYRDAGGAWQPIDTTLVRHEDGYTTAAAPVAVSLVEETASEAPVTLERPSGAVSLDLLGALEDGALVVGDLAIYPLVRTATDLVYEATGDGVKETLLLASAAAPERFSFEVCHPGYTLARDDAGQWGLTAAGAARPAFLVGELCVFDSSRDEADEPVYCDGARLQVEPGVERSIITYELPRAWLDDPTRVWPVHVDPSLFTRNPTDTYVSEGYPNTAYGSSETLLCGKVSSSAKECRALLRFPQVENHDNIAHNAHIRSATFSVRQYWQPATNHDRTHVYRLYETCTDWGEGVKWNTLTVTGKQEISPNSFSPDGQTWLEVGCPGIVQGWVSHTYGNRGFMIAQQADEGASYARKFRSSNYTGGAEWWPKLYVIWEQPTMSVSGQPTVARLGDTLTVNVDLAQVSDADEVTGVRLGINRAAGPESRYRGVLAWFRDDPGAATPGWQPTQVAGQPGYFAVWDSSGGSVDYGSSHLAVQWDACAVDLEARRVTFAFKLKDDFGDLQDNDLDTRLDMTSGGGEWTSDWVNHNTDLDIGPPHLAAAPSAATTASDWFSEPDADGDGLPDAGCDAGGQGRGSVTLSWPQVPLASAYGIYLFDGHAYRKVGSSTTTTWTSAGKGIYPTDTQIAALPAGYEGDPFRAGAGLDLRDSANALYAKTAGTSYDARYDYAFKVVPTNDATGAQAPPSEADPVAEVALDNRTRHVREAPRHTPCELAEWADHRFTALLDAGRFEATVCDLAVASWGPPASLERTYAAAAKPGVERFAPGWWFSFERRLTPVPASATLATCTQLDYWDARGEPQRFAKSTGVWLASNGLAAGLAGEASTWTLALKDGSRLVFDAGGRLQQERDANGNTVDYLWSGEHPDRIVAANGQAIELTCDADGRLTEATCAAGGATRQVLYTAPGRRQPYWRVTAYPGEDCERLVEYGYDEQARLTQVRVPDWDREGHTAQQEFVYGSDPDLVVRFADWDATAKPDARCAVDYDVGGVARLTRYGTVMDAPDTAVHEDYQINPTGTLAWRHNPCSSNDPDGEGELWRSRYSPDNQPAGEEDPLGHATRSIYDVRGNLLVAYDALGHATRHRYDAADRCVETVDALGSVTTQSYDAAGNLVLREQLLNAAGEKARSEYAYAEVTVGGRPYRGALVSERDQIAVGEWAQTDYSDFAPCGEPGRERHPGVKLSLGGSPLTLEVHRSYDGFGNLLGESRQHDIGDSSPAVAWQAGYDAAGRLLTEELPAAGALSAVTTHHEYDRLGYETASWTTSSRADVAQVRCDYRRVAHDACGRPTLETRRLSTQEDPEGTIQDQTAVVYDGCGRVIESDDSTVPGLNERLAYDAAGNLTRKWVEGLEGSAYPDSAALRQTYDALGRLVNEYDAEATTPATTVYAATGQVQTYTTEFGSTVGYEYDAAANLTRTLKSGEETADLRTTNDLAGRPVVERDLHAGTVRTQAYDLLGRVTWSQEGTDTPTTTDYNALGWVLRESGPDGVTTNTYDATGALLESTTPTGSIVRQYDAHGRETSITEDGETVSTGYDPWGREYETQTVSAGVATEHTVATLDSLGNETASYDALAEVRDTWQDCVLDGRLWAIHTMSYSPGPVPNATTRIEPDSLGRETSRTTTVVRGQESVQLQRTVPVDGGRDGEDRIVRATTLPQDGVLQTTRTSYDAAGRTVRQWGSGFAAAAETTDAYAYDAQGQKVSEDLRLAMATLAGDYAYADGRLVSWTDRRGAPAVTTTYAYDAQGRLRSRRVSGSTAYRCYDGSSLRLLGTTTAPDGGGSYLRAYTWDGADRLLSEGSSPSSQTVTYGYSSLGQLATLAVSGGSPVTATYAYRGQGARTRSVVTQAGVTTTTDYRYAGGALVQVSASTSTGASWRLDYLYDEENRPYAGVYWAGSAPPVVFSVVTSDDGDVVELLDADGAPFALYSYDPFGVPAAPQTSGTSRLGAAVAAELATRQVLRFKGYCFDAESGLLYTGEGYYHPGLGSEIQLLQGTSGSSRPPVPKLNNGVPPFIEYRTVEYPSDSNLTFANYDWYKPYGKHTWRFDHPACLIVRSKRPMKLGAVNRIFRSKLGYKSKLADKVQGKWPTTGGMWVRASDGWKFYTTKEATKKRPHVDPDSFYHVRFYAAKMNGTVSFKKGGWYWVVGTAHVDVNELALFRDWNWAEGWGGPELLPSGFPKPSVPSDHTIRQWKFGGNAEWVEKDVRLVWRTRYGGGLIDIDVKPAANMEGCFIVTWGPRRDWNQLWSVGGKWYKSNGRMSRLTIPTWSTDL